MIEIFAKVLYTAALLAIIGICAREAVVVWWDDTLQYGKFAATTDGRDSAATGDVFRRFVVQQQAVLFGLFKSGGTRRDTFRFGDNEIQIQDVSELGNLPSSLLDDVKIEAGGVDVASVLTALRRAVKPPNEVSGSIDQLGNDIHVVARWKGGSRARTFVLKPQKNIEDASFELACLIFLARVSTKHPVLGQADEDDFCQFALALKEFRDYLGARDRTGADRETVVMERLKPVRARVERLVASNTELPYIYKLAGYIEIELLSAPGTGTEQIKEGLDRAETLFGDYIERLAEIDPRAKDADVQDRLAFLAARRGQLENPKQVAEAPSVGAFVKAARSLFSGDKRVATIERSPAALGLAGFAPGASVGDANKGNAGTLCCFVKDASGNVYFLTAAHLTGPKGSELVSPARIDSAQSQTIGTVEEILQGVALVALAPGLGVSNGAVTPSVGTVTNGQISSLAPTVSPAQVVTLIGRTSRQTGAVLRVNATIPIIAGTGLPVDGLIMTDSLAIAGDSGAPVLDAENRLIGMLVARSQRESIVLPLKPIFEKHGLTLLGTDERP